MAISFCRVIPISRKKGQSIVASAAYRACVSLYDQRNEKRHDYSKKHGHLAGDLVIPEGVSLTQEEWVNLIENCEKRIDARLGRDFVIALPDEFSLDINIEISKAIAKELTTEVLSNGEKEYYSAQWDIHDSHREALLDDEGNFVVDDKGNKIMEDNKNKHLHILIPERAWNFETNSFSKKKNRDRNSDDWLQIKKLKIGEIMNEYLVRYGYEPVDFRDWNTRNQESIEKTGMGLAPPQTHLGPAKANMRRKEEKKLLRKKTENKMEISALVAALNKLDKQSKGELQSMNNQKRLSEKFGNMTVWKKEINSAVNANLNKPKPSNSPVHLPVVTESSRGIKMAHSTHVKTGSGPEVKCFLCEPGSLELCKHCKFFEEEIENSKGVTHGRS